MHIGIIGTGNMGSGLGKQWAVKGHHVFADRVIRRRPAPWQIRLAPTGWLRRAPVLY
jgi:3-hydroxyisobutyrate dehydrogenase-like beta-hydroxyacid dehydrogenase